MTMNVTPCNIKTELPRDKGGNEMSGAIERAIDTVLGDGSRARQQKMNALPGSDDWREIIGFIQEPTQWMHEHFERYGRVFKTRIVAGTVFMIGSEANRSIMLTRRMEFGEPQGYEQTNIKHIFKGSIMLRDGEDHKALRRILLPAFNRLAVRESGHDVQHSWRKHFAEGATQDSVDAYHFARLGTFYVAANKLTGLALGGDTEQFAPYMQQIIHGAMQSIPLRIPGGPLDKAIKARDAVIHMLMPRIEELRQQEPEGLVGQLAHYRDENGRLMPTEELASHLVFLFWAGYDTTASASSWILHRLARRPDWQRRLREELLAIDPDDLDTLEKGKATPETEWFLFETERYTPSVILFPRIALQDIEYDGFVIPEGTPIFYSPYMSGRDPASFPNPNCFDPDRWNPDLGDDRAQVSDLYGFGGGPRICLGKAFAKLQMKILLYELLTRYHVEVDDRTTHTVMGLPIHHPVDSKIRIRPLQ